MSSSAGIRELTADELQFVSGGDGEGSCGPGDCGVACGDAPSGGMLGEVTVTATAENPSEGSNGNPMNLIPSGLGLLGATIGMIIATTTVGVALATIAGVGAVMTAVVNNNESMPVITPWGGPGGDIPAGP